ncbi:MAG: hypothetical protein QOK47_673 [Actinomycetota bacterium]|nr:hypothetical protein [Actinomycetota bacterium]
MEQPPVKRSKRVYLLVPAVFLLLAIPSVWLLVTGISNLAEGLVRFTAPGDSTITIAEPGRYTVFHEYRSNFNGNVYNGAPQLPTVNIQMTGPAGESPIVQPSTGDFNYNFGSTAGYSVGAVEIDKPGEYEVHSGYASGSGPGVVLALGREKAKSTLQTVGGGFGLAAAFGISFMIWLIIFIVRLARSKKVAPAYQDPSNPAPPTI